MITSIDHLRQKIHYSVTHNSINTIEIEFKNKQPNDTVVVDGQIVEDLLITIEELSIDKIELFNNLSKISVYKGDNGTVYRTFNYITFNGVMTIKIHKNPIYTNWLSNLV